MRFLCWFLAKNQYLCNVVRNHQIKHSYGKISKNIRAHGAGTALLSLHPAALSLAEVKVTPRRRSRSPASNNAEAPFIPPVGSKHYLPTPRTPLKCPVLGAFDDFCSIVMRAPFRLREKALRLTIEQSFVGRRFHPDACPRNFDK